MPLSKAAAQKRAYSKCKLPVVCAIRDLHLAHIDAIPEGEIADLLDELSDGRMQFVFLKLKDANTQLPKSVLIAWVRYLSSDASHHN